MPPEDKVEDQLSTRTASSSSFPRTGSSRDEESPGQSSGSAAAALFAAVLVATGREAKVQEDVQPDGSKVKPVKQLHEALQDVQRRTEHVETKIRIAAAECNALERRIEGLALAHRRRELEVADVWQDVEAGMVSAQEVLKTSADLRESAQQEVTELGCLQKEVRRQAVAVQVLRRWHDEAEAHHPKTRLAVLTAQLADERRRRSKEIQQEMDEISRLEDLLRNVSGAA